jgi:hypothetical protein
MASNGVRSGRSPANSNAENAPRTKFPRPSDKALILGLYLAPVGGRKRKWPELWGRVIEFEGNCKMSVVRTPGTHHTARFLRAHSWIHQQHFLPFADFQAQFEQSSVSTYYQRERIQSHPFAFIGRGFHHDTDLQQNAFAAPSGYGRGPRVPSGDRSWRDSLTFVMAGFS